MGCQIRNVVRVSLCRETGTRIQRGGDRVSVASDYHGHDVYSREEQVLWCLLDRELQDA